MYDLITRVPMVVWAPSLFEGGRSIDGLCQHMDIGPALLELAGLEVPESFEALSLLPALKGEPWTPRDYVYAEQIKDGTLTDTEFMSMIRSQKWKLVHFLGLECGQLFNLEEDPHELTNLWSNPSVAEIKAKLLNQLMEWHIESQVQTRTWSASWR